MRFRRGHNISFSHLFQSPRVQSTDKDGSSAVLRLTLTMMG